MIILIMIDIIIVIIIVITKCLKGEFVNCQLWHVGSPIFLCLREPIFIVKLECNM